MVAEATADDLLKELSDRSDIDWEEVDDLIEILREATKRVVEHGKRADEIVKNMLLHARGKEETKIDIDVAHMTCDFTRLAVKGTNQSGGNEDGSRRRTPERFTPLIVSAQGLSRVIINLVTNAVTKPTRVQSPPTTLEIQKFLLSRVTMKIAQN